MSDQFLLFISDYGRHLLTSYEHWASDGTFSTCPTPYDQIYFIGIKTQDGKFIPAGYCLLKGKYRDIYRSLFETIISHVGSVNHVQTFTVDFKQAVISVIDELFPNVTVKGCLFHQRQAIFRNLQKNHCIA